MANTDDEEATVPYQFEVPITLHAEVMDKANKHGVKMAPFMRMVFEKFAMRPISESLQVLEAHNESKSRKRRTR